MERSISIEYREMSPFNSTSVEIVEVCGGMDEEQSKIEPKDRFFQVLDGLQKSVEMLRYHAQKLEDEKDAVLANLDYLRNSKTLQSLPDMERSEIENYMDMINKRCQTVNINVETSRDGAQEESLHKVNTLIDSMILTLRKDPKGTHGRCVSFIRACSTCDADEVLYAMVRGLQPMHADKGFEEALLGCTLDDQKFVKRRLNGLLDYILKL